MRYALGSIRTKRISPVWAVVLLGLTVYLTHSSTVAAAGQQIVSLPLDETSGTTASDLSGSGNNGSLQNGPVWTAGRQNGSLSFDGIDDTLFINDSPSLDPPGAGITVAAWIYRTANEGRWMSVASRQVGNTYYEHFYLGFNDKGQYRWFVNTTSGYSTQVGGIAPLGQWVHVVGTYDGSFARLYVNGVQQFQVAHTGAFNADSTGITIGASHNNAAHTPIEAFNGKVDEFRLYHGALTPTEVVQLYQSLGGPAVDVPPNVTLTSPSAGTRKGAITATATAFDDIEVVGVQFMVDGFNNGPEDTTAPYSSVIETTAYSEGVHVLSAVARDAAGNVTVSTPVTVTFDNIAVMPLGDSLTAGFVGTGHPDNDSGGYRRYLWESLRTAGVHDMNFVGSVKSGIPTMDRDHEGHGGFRIDQITTGVTTWIPAFNPDIFLLLIGTNDFIQGATVSQALTRLGTLLNKIHTLRPSARIILATEPGVLANNAFGMNPQLIVDYNAAMPALVSNRVAQGWDISLVDLYGLAGLNRSAGSPDYNSDGLHLTLTGYSKLAAPWFGALNAFSDTTPPSTPTGLSAIASSFSTIDLSWTASTDDLTGVAAYRVYRDGIAVATPTGTTYQDGGLTANTTYSYTVTAIDWADNESDASESDAATTPTAPPVDVTPPSVPTGLAATATSSTTIELTWAASADPGPGVSTVDTFDRADGSLGSSWTGLSGTFQIVSQHVEPATSGTFTTAGLTTWVGSGDQWAETAVTVTGLNSGGGPVVRAGTGGANLYLVDYNGRADHKLFKRIGGVLTALGGWTDPASPGDVVRLEAIGSTIRVLVNGVQKVSVTNTEVTGGVPGVYAFRAAGQQLQLDSFAAQGSGPGMAVAGYRIYRGGNPVATTAATTYVDGGRTPNTSYTYTVTAYDGASNESAPSAPASAVTLPAGAPQAAIMALPFNDGSGTLASDASGNGNHGTLKNGPVWTTGVTGTALQFDGSNDVVEVAPSATIAGLTAQVTVAAWVYRATAQTTWAAVVSRQRGTTAGEHFYLGFSNTGQYRWFVNTTAGVSSKLGGTAPVGQWVHMVGTYDGSTIRFYVNGVQQATAAHSGTFLNDTTGLVVGAGYNDAAHTPVEALAGRIDDVQVYGIALDANAVAQVYATSQQPPTDVTPPSVPTGLAATATSTTTIELTWTGSSDVGPSMSDTFNRGDGALGGAWTGLSGTFQIVSQHVEPASSGTYTTAGLTTWVGSGNQWAETAVTVTGLNSGGGPVVRAGTGGANLYLVDYNGRADHKLFKRIGGVLTALGGWTDPASPGDVVRLEAIGSTIRVLVNGVQKVSVTNAEVTGGVPGVYAFRAAGQQLQLDSFVAASPGSVTYRVYRGGNPVATTAATTYVDGGRTPNTSYTYTVTAYDGASNESAPSAPASAVTLPAGAPQAAIMALPFNDGSGTLASDASGNGNHGTLKNGPVWTTGVTGTALQFDGSNDVVEVAPSATIAGLTAQVTVAAWVYRATAQTTWAAVVSRQRGTTAGEHFYLGFSNTGQYRWFVNTTAGVSSKLGGTAPVGQWVHMVGTYDGSTIRFYVNGVQQATAAHSGTFLNDTTGLVVGAGYNDAAHTPVEALAGRIDDVQVYGIALDANAVAQVYATSQQPPTDVTPPSVPTGLAATATSTTTIELTWTGSSDVGPSMSDTFNRGDGALGGAWTGLSGTFQIVSQHVEPASSGTFTTAGLTTWVGSGNQWAETAVTVTGLNSGGGPVVRAGTGGANLYLVDYNGRADHKLFKRIGGVLTALGGWTDPASPGDVVRLEAIGSTIRVLVNGVQKVSVTNTEVTGGVPGVYAFRAAGQQLQLDSFVAASPGSVTYRIYRGGNPVATTAATTYVDGGRTPNTSYTYTVTAYDGAGNESAPSAPASATTLP